ncbi:MAG: hypothetical protein ACTHJT_14700 [Cytophaga sp.]|uniref:hypothetical protein n=1 Tax=Cytophaga sp. TaxID=29535 RepID=UPI003F7D67DB
MNATFLTQPMVTLPSIDYEGKSKSTQSALSDSSDWKGYEKTAFRITCIYVLFLCLPLYVEWYIYLSYVNLSELNCRDLFIISTYRTIEFVKINTESGRWGIASYVNLAIPLAISIVAGLVWSALDKKTKNYDQLYYWIRVIARYRVGIGIVAWGFRKLVPGQMVWPTTGILNTPFVDFQAQKLYWQSVGIVPGYEIFLGAAEFIAGFLLLFRKTTALGAALTAVVLGNIVIANHAYDGSVHVHSFCYTILALIILWKDFPNIWNLLVREKDVFPQTYYPSFTEPLIKYTRLTLITFVHVVFVALFFVLQVDDYIHAPYRLPDTPGLTKAQGVYQVTEFKLNNKVRPYDPLDSVRWQDAIFESWSTISFKVNRTAVMDQSNGGGYSKKDVERTWELAGIGGGRRYFYYEADTVKQELRLFNKNEKHKKETLTLHYNRPTDTRIVLTGANEFEDSLYVVLDREEKTYPVIENRDHTAVWRP